MTETSADKPSKQGPPVQFRPGPELEQLVGSFAEQTQVPRNEAFKNLAALAIVGLDRRYFNLVNQMAAAMKGANPFVRACIQIHTAILGAVRLRGGQQLDDPERSLFVLDTVRDFLGDKGGTVQTEGLWFVPAESPSKQSEYEQPITRVRRRVGRQIELDPDE